MQKLSLVVKFGITYSRKFHCNVFHSIMATLSNSRIFKIFNITQLEVQNFKKTHFCITIPCTSSTNCIYHFVCHVHFCFFLLASIKKKSNVPRGVDGYGDEVTLPSVPCRCPPGQCVPHSSRKFAQSFGLAMVKQENPRAIFHDHSIWK